MYNALDREIYISQLEDTFNWSTLFGNSRPVEVEFGCGKGRFIIRSAQENPEINYFGIEKSSKFFHLLKKRVSKSGLQNIRLIKWEASYFTKKYIPKCSVQTYHIYFPDPWPKKRHHKRRLVSVDFLESLTSSLKSKGCIYFATDYLDYFNNMVNLANACEILKEIYCHILRSSEANPEEAVTHYERKYLLQGRTIYKAAYQKIE